MSLREKVGSLIETNDLNGDHATREMICEWNERYELAPMRGESWPDNPNLVCVSRTLEGYGKPMWQPADPWARQTGRPVYTHCKITAEYASRALPQYPAVSADFGVETREILGSTIYIPTIELRMSIEVDSWDPTPVFNMLGKVNQYAWNNGAPGSFLFQGAAPDLQYQNEAGYRVRVTYVFLYRRQGWNAEPDPTDPTGAWLAKSNYPEGDFELLGLQNFFWV